MPSLNFQKQFAPLVESGDKPHTIRAKRKHPIKQGDTLYLYTGLRTKKARRLKVAKCTAVLPISITRDGVEIYPPVDKEELAKKDGFKSFDEMASWFDKTHGLPFNGDLICWNP